MMDARRPVSLDRHQSDGFQRPMIEAASVSFHPTAVALPAVLYNRNVVLIIDW